MTISTTEGSSATAVRAAHAPQLAVARTTAAAMLHRCAAAAAPIGTSLPPTAPSHPLAAVEVFLAVAHHPEAASLAHHPEAACHAAVLLQEAAAAACHAAVAPHTPHTAVMAVAVTSEDVGNGV